jgi:hypothetical protein
MSTLADMKTRIALELRRDDLTTDIGSAITSAIQFYQYEPFPTFNTSSVQAAPANDGEINNPWMNYAEPLIRNRAKGELYAGIIKEPQNAQIYFGMATEWLAKLKISTLFQSLANYTPGTLGYMKAKIANEIERGDLTNEIAAAVSTAIIYYENERFFFNETRDVTWNTVAKQFVYTASDVADIGNLVNVDYLFAYIGGQPYRVLPLFQEVMEWSHLASNDPVGQPLRFTYYAQALNLYPTPDQAYSMRLGGAKSVPGPASDGETGNIWMTTCEDMVRARAKFELYTHIPRIADANKALTMKGLADDAFGQLRERTSDLEKVGEYIIEAWGY